MYYQEDLLEIYNSLVKFNDLVIKAPNPKPILVKFDKNTNITTFILGGMNISLLNPIYFSLALETIPEEGTYLLPEDYSNLMYNLQYVINSGELLKEKTLISPENYGFDVYSINPKDFLKGLEIIGSVRFISGNSWWFRFKTKLKYDL